MIIKTSIEDIFIESWHKVYPNRKREKNKLKKSKKLSYFDILDKLLSLGYENKVYLSTSLEMLLIEKNINNKLNNGFMKIIFDTISATFKIEVHFSDREINVYEALSLDDATNRVIKEINTWLKK
jgi:hypothetical protein